MKTKLLSILVVSTFAYTLANGEDTKEQGYVEHKTETKTKLRPGELKERLDKYMGGIIEKEGSSKGWICFISEQNILDKDALAAYVAIMRQGMRLEMKVGNAKEPFRLDNAKRLAIATGANATVFIVESDTLPISLVAPESGWAVVNVSPLAKNIPASIAKERIKKAVLRTFCILCGAYDSGTAGTILWPATTPEDFDALQNPTVIPPTLVAPVGGHMVRSGMRPIVFSSYRKACEAGWAPSPTNDIQKAIWNEINSVPKEPMKIEFDPKKGR